MENAPVVLPIELTPAQVRPVAYRIISKRHGLNLKSPALAVLAQFLGHHFGADWRGAVAEKSLDEISRRWKNEDRGIFVDGPELQQVVKDWVNAQVSSSTTPEKFDWRQYFAVVSATDQKRVVYESAKKNFVSVPDAPAAPFGPAKSLTAVFAARYEILLDKLYRSEKFQPPGLVSPLGASANVITPIKNLLGRSQNEAFYLFGLLEKQQDGPWTLYDPTASIELAFGEYSEFFPDNYYTSGCFVIAYGQLHGGRLLVSMMGPPPVEQRTASQEAYGRLDFYGFLGMKNSKRLERFDPNLELVLQHEEQKMPQNRVVMLGADIFLDLEPVVDGLRRLFLRLETSPPIALVMCGSFMSQPYSPYVRTQDGRSAAQVYRDGMNALADVLHQCPNLAATTKFVLIPGPNDPWHAMSKDVLPYRPLPSVFTGRISHAVHDIVWATNPCRLFYLSKEILLYRGDCAEKLRNNSLDTDLYAPAADADMDAGAEVAMEVDGDAPAAAESAAEALGDLSLAEEREADRAAVQAMFDQPAPETRAAHNDRQESRAVLATLLNQCHLSPLSLSVSPVMWEYDNSLSMAQWPTALALFDSTAPRTKQTYEACDIMNPGKFWHNGMVNWLEYWPTEGSSKFMEMV